MKLTLFILFPLLTISVFVFLILYDQEAQSQLRHELSKSQKETIANLGDLQGDFETIQSFRDNNELMKSIHVLFRAQCASCHAPLGTGQLAPNLCDDSYLLVKNIPDLYTVISEGSIKKGMLPFKGILSNNELVLLAAYTANLRGSASSGKQAEGKIIAPWPE
ncbi:MAG: cytochrome c [Phycisphaerae bacterium]|jgi:cytochrome c oxidase cbb3-type subunit III|nr:cytochrome c [Phycisphaerae bacterium]